MKSERVRKDFKIVVVDDSNLSRRGMVEILESEEYDVVGEANSAEKAIEISSNIRPNLYIIDVVMPEVSGIELAKYLTNKFPRVKIIMFSSLKTENVIIESIASGATDFLQRPFAPKDLLTSVEKIFREGD